MLQAGKNQNKAVKSASKACEENLNLASLHIISPLKWMTLSGKKLSRSAIKNPRYARVRQMHTNFTPFLKTKPSKSAKQLNKSKSIRLLSITIQNSDDNKYYGELNRLFMRSHYLQRFHAMINIPVRKDYFVIKKQLLRQRNLKSLTLNCNWMSHNDNGEKESKIEARLQADLINRVGKKLERLVIADIINANFGKRLLSSCLSNLKTFIFATTSDDIDNYQPEYTFRTHGLLVKKVLSISTLRDLNIRAINNFTELEFFKTIKDCLEDRKEPLRIDVGAGIWDYFQEIEDDYEKKYDIDLKNIFIGLKEGKSINFSSSWSVFKIIGGTGRIDQADSGPDYYEDSEEEEEEEDEEEKEVEFEVENEEEEEDEEEEGHEDEDDDN